VFGDSVFRSAPARDRCTTRGFALAQVWILADDGAKWGWLSANLATFLAEGKVLVFVGNRIGCDELSGSVNRLLGGTMTAPKCLAIHGERTQQSRDDAIRQVCGHLACVTAKAVFGSCSCRAAVWRCLFPLSLPTFPSPPPTTTITRRNSSRVVQFKSLWPLMLRRGVWTSRYPVGPAWCVLAAAKLDRPWSARCPAFSFPHPFWLSVQDIRTVVNFDKARSMDLHVHRVGRCVLCARHDDSPLTLLCEVTRVYRVCPCTRCPMSPSPNTTQPPPLPFTGLDVWAWMACPLVWLTPL
jgi:hypothetical protein